MPQSLNEKTIASYEKNMQQFLNNTTQQVSGPFKTWLDLVLSYITPHDSILEIGSGFGRDADYIESCGFRVQRTDATEAFIEHMQAQGHGVAKLNLLTDDLGGPHRLILANAVLLHFTRDEVKTILTKVYNHLKDGGYFAFTVKQGSGENWESHKLDDGRFFCYWEFEQLYTLLLVHGFRVIAVYNDVVPSSPRAKWVRILVQK